jgi:predicted TIM-barrel fold metal-dependent hydrolase
VFDEQAIQVLLRVMNRMGVERAFLVGSPDATFIGAKAVGFNGYRTNNELIRSAAMRCASRLAYFAAIDIRDSDHLEYAKEQVARGARGVKLYVGHGGRLGNGYLLHSVALNDTSLFPLWSWLEGQGVPAIVHINLKLFWREWESVMERFPRLRVNIPHLGLLRRTTDDFDRLSSMLLRFQGLYTDLSFGAGSLQLEAVGDLISNRRSVIDFLGNHHRKVMYGTDLIVYPHSNETHLADIMRDYSLILVDREVSMSVRPMSRFAGFSLPDSVVDWIFYRAAIRWLETTPP